MGIPTAEPDGRIERLGWCFGGIGIDLDDGRTAIVESLDRCRDDGPR
jgi:hypothetical protein